MIASADKDGTGTLDLIEFLQMMKEKVRDQNKEEEITEAFKVFDIVSFYQDKPGFFFDNLYVILELIVVNIAIFIHNLILHKLSNIAGS